ncbi:DUF4276 family protein [Variovorax sp. JS1663]|uniref:DUF4276 family protein n=1 Tax=Variovorax sp. JS1663 TaxID=1851577 RepID=UPI0013020E79|nr:DUF4276 family protein [Variovorax sp. JS1663]
MLILVEGQTEERFVKDVLAPFFEPSELFVTPVVLVTKRIKDGPNFKGGVTHFAKFESDLRRLLRDSDALVTTMLDYYGLPADFPGMSTRPVAGSPWDRVRHIEMAVDQHFGNPDNLRTFLALHEFEAWLFADTGVLPDVMAAKDLEPALAAIRAGVDTPEHINEAPQTAPSKRIEGLFPAYRKRLHGPNTAQRIGIERIRQECPHFSRWVAELEAFAR